MKTGQTLAGFLRLFKASGQGQLGGKIKEKSLPMYRETFVAQQGLEPRHTDPESVVLPLYYWAKDE